MSYDLVAILMFALVIISLLVGVPVAFSLGGIGTIVGFIVFGPNIFDQFIVITWGV